MTLLHPWIGVARTIGGHPADMSVYVVWTSADLTDLDPDRDLPGPWREVRVAADHLCFVDSDDTLSRVYHQLKWALPEGVALSVAPLAGPPKTKGLRAGTTTWLRARLGCRSPAPGAGRAAHSP